MRRLGGRFRCFAVDTLGFGGSDPLAAKATMEDLARSMVHFLDALKIGRAHVLGFHTGNKIAAAMAAGHPDRVGKAVLIGMTHSLVISRKRRDAAIMDPQHRVFLEVCWEAFEHAGVVPDRFDGRIGVFGQIPVVFADFGIPNPSRATISTDDHGILELKLAFARA